MISQGSPTPSEIESKEAMLTRFRDELVVDPVPKELRRVLQGVAHFAKLDSKGEFAAKRAPTKLFTLHGSPTPSMYVRMGLAPLVKRVLKETGYQVKNKTFRLNSLPVPDIKNLQTFKSMDSPLIKSVYFFERALIKIDLNMISPSALVAQAAIAWPKNRIAVFVSRIEEANRIARELRSQLNRIVVTHHVKNRWEPPANVVVTTFAYANQWPFYADEYDLVFALNVQEALGEEGRRALEASFNARLFGLLDKNAELSPREEDHAASFFGFEQVSIPRHGYLERPVVLHWDRIVGGERVSVGANILTLKREGIWSHGLRNRRIAKVAKGLRRRLPVEGEDIRPTDFGAFPGGISKAGNGVIVLVDNVEHALALARHLPDWALITGPRVNEEGLSGSSVAILSQRKTQPDFQYQFAIVTFAGIGCVNFDLVQFVIRADGGVGLPPISDYQLAVPNTIKINSLVVVDFVDSHNSFLEHLSERRAKAYEKRNWFKGGVVPREGRLERFLKSRPRS
jgi:hypothetical protein